MTVSSKTIAQLSNNPLFSCIITLYLIFLLYFPLALQLSLSLVFTLAVLLLLLLLRLSAGQRIRCKNPESKECIRSVGDNGDTQLIEVGNSEFSTQFDKWVPDQSKAAPDPSPNPDFEESFVEWNVRAPLEVIYEAYEGEEDGEDPNHERNIERYPSLAMYYPETDSDSSSDGESPVNGEWGSAEIVCFEWEEEIREGLLIEISLDANGKKDSGPDFPVEEANLIEIDISPDSGQAWFL